MTEENCRSVPSARSPLAVDRLFVLLWTAFLLSWVVLKFSASLTGWPDFNTHFLEENRRLVDSPQFRSSPVKDWSANITAWYEDNFAFRDRIIHAVDIFHFNILRSPQGGRIPGKDGWIFRRGGDWAEANDYLGCYELTDQELRDWITVFEGRVEWARLLGIVYLEIVTPSKAYVHPEKMPPYLTRHKGVSCQEQLERALRGSPAEEHVLFLTRSMREAAADHEMFYHEDHHPSPRGLHFIYSAIAERLARWFPDSAPLPFYDDPPAAVLANREPGCWEKDGRLAVSVPGARAGKVEIPGGRNASRSMKSFTYRQAGSRRSMVIAHDSFLRFSLLSWLDGGIEKVRLPIGPVVDKVSTLLFHRYTTTTLEEAVRREIPAIIAEQFTQVRFNLGVKGIDDVMRRASAFSHGKDCENGFQPRGAEIRAAVVLDEVRNPNGNKNPIFLIAYNPDGSKNRAVAWANLRPGIRRVVFFPSFLSQEGEVYRLDLGDATSATTNLLIRTAP